MSVPLRIHLYIAPAGLAVKTVLPPAQKDVAPETDTAGLAFIVAVTAVLEVDKHPVVVFLTCA
jgi:hypothetical protein